MFGSLTYLQLQEYWWFLVAVLAAMFVFMNFVQGGQMLLHTLGKSESERDVIVNTLGRKWELSFTTLVMFGGALFAAFPLFYAVSFGGAYYVWMAILFCFIIQAVAYEYRKKPNNFFGERVYEWFMLINGSLGIFLIGVALGTLFTGGNFVVDANHLSHWTKPTYGLEALGNWFNLAFGFMLVFLARVQAELYFINSIAEESIVNRAKKWLKIDTALFLLFFLAVVYGILTMSGYSYDNSGKVFVESHKFLHNLIAMPLVTATIAIGALMVLGGICWTLLKNSTKGIWCSGIGTMFVVIGLVLMLGYNHTAFYPSLADMQSSLTIQNASGSKYTLTAMSYVSIMVPFVLAYIIWAWRAMNKDRVTIKEIESDGHHY